MSQLLLPLIYVLAFVAVVLAAQAIANLVFTASDSTKRVNRRLTMLESGMKPDEVYAALVRRQAPLALGDGAIAGFYDRLALRLRQSGLELTMRQVFMIVGALAGALWVLSLAPLSQAKGAFALNALVAMAGAALVAWLLVWLYIERRRGQRLKKIEEQLPLALDIVNRAIRAGHPVVSAVQLAATELGDPVGSEFGLIVDETTYGLEFRDALVSFARRTGSQDAHFFAVSVGIQSETGGNLAEILEGLAGVIRGRMALGQKVKALASEGKASAAILSALPIFLIGMLALFQPHFYTDKFSDPVFWPVVGGVIVVYGIGQLLIYRIVNFKY
ncbi:type II secretion system F family protein [Caulobacter sp. KR2-114]|uniref:type II secretion system F family protein n=1 Tax=Caulobacter sp. KR2-114 TaxID=3400912 RepID=UPI003C00FB27